MADISSISNNRIKLARKLQRKRYRDETGLCLLEGPRLIGDAWAAASHFESLFVVDTLAIGDDLAFVEAMRAVGVPLFTVTAEVMAALTETVTPQGVAALCAIPQVDLPASPQLTLILDRVRDPGNAGTLLRCAAAAGVDAVLFAPESVDPYNDKVLRAGMGAHFRLPLRICDNWAEIATHVAGQAVYVADAAAPLPYDHVEWGQPAALIIGNEAGGPGDEALRLGKTVSIPMHRQTESLNAAIAGAVILFEAARQTENADRAQLSGSHGSL